MKSDGVRTYAHATLDIFFPDNNICCAMCPLLEEYQRKQCRMTGEYIGDVKGVGMWCKLNVVDLDLVKDEKET